MVKYKITLANNRQFILFPGDIIHEETDQNGRRTGKVVLALPTNPDNIFAGRIVRTFAAWYVSIKKLPE